MQHLYGNGRTYFVTFRLVDSLPQSILMELKREYKCRIDSIKETNPIFRQEIIDNITIDIFGKYDHQLDKFPYGKCVLKDENIASMLSAQILKYHKIYYELKCYSIMPNHVHILISSLDNEDENVIDKVETWMKLIKGGSSRYINLAMKTSGQLWVHESWDRMIRNEKHYSNSFYYTINNPEKAALPFKFTQMPFMWRCDRDV